MLNFDVIWQSDNAGAAKMQVYQESDEIAACASEIALAGGKTPPAEILLMPAGIVETRPNDSRPPWRNDAPDQVLAATRALKVPLKIDYNHASEGGAPTADAGIAAGWINELFIRDGAIWGQVEWTEKAAAHIAAGEYKFVSPTFRYARDTRRVTRIDGAGLVNEPAVYMRALASAQGQQQQEKKSVSKMITEKLGLAENADPVAICAAIEALQAQIETAKATAAAKTEMVDPNKFVPRDLFDGVQARLVAIESGMVEEKALAAVNKAVEDGKLPPAQRDWGIGYAKSDPTGFDSFIKGQPRIVGGAVVTGQPDGGQDTLNADEKAMCRTMGLSEESFLKSKKSISDRSKGE